MKIQRFDACEYDVLQCTVRGGYYPFGEHATRAMLLMNEGVFEVNPKINWHKNGWKLTEYGEKYYQSFMKKVAKKHGYKWMTNHEDRSRIQ